MAAQNGLYPVNPRTGQPTATALRVFAQYAALKSYCEANTLPIRYRDAATFSGDFFKSHAAYFGDLLSVNGRASTFKGDEVGTQIVLSLVSEPLGLARGNVALRPVAGAALVLPA